MAQARVTAAEQRLVEDRRDFEARIAEKEQEIELSKSEHENTVNSLRARFRRLDKEDRARKQTEAERKAQELRLAPFSAYYCEITSVFEAERIDGKLRCRSGSSIVFAPKTPDRKVIVEPKTWTPSKDAGPGDDAVHVYIGESDEAIACMRSAAFPKGDDRDGGFDSCQEYLENFFLQKGLSQEDVRWLKLQGLVKTTNAMRKTK